MPTSRDDRIVEKGGFKYIRLKGGRLMSFFNAYDEAKKAHTAFTRSISRAYTLLDEGDYDVQMLTWLLEEAQTYCAYLLKLIEERHGVKTQEERIALLRNVEGRTPEEAESYRRKADEMESRMEAAR